LAARLIFLIFLRAAMSERLNRLYEFGPFRLDAVGRVLTRDGEVVPLAPKALDMLIVLVEHRGEVLDKDQLLAMLWPDSFVEEANLPQNVSALRKALGEGPNERRYIVTVPRRGYKFAAAVRQAADDGDVIVARYTKSTLVIQDETNEPESEARSQRLPPAPLSAGGRRNATLISLAVIAFTLGALALYVFVIRSHAPAQPIRSIAVLPLANGGGDPDMDYLSDGISESLINRLSQLPGLKVIARSSSFKYKGKDADPQEVAQALGVEAIVTGRLLQRGDALLISIELMDARDKTQVWGEQYSRRAADLLAIQSEISGEIARNLRMKLSNDEQQQLARRETVSPQAYELMLKGRFNWFKGTTEDRKKAVEYYQQAIALDPAYALAYAELTLKYTELIGVSVLDPNEFIPKAEAAARMALALDDGLAEAHLAAANIKLIDWDWAAALQEIRRALDLNPNLAMAHATYGGCLTTMGQHEQAIAEYRRARELNPLVVIPHWSIGFTLLLARRNDEAIEAANKTLELFPNYPPAYNLLGYAYAAKGQYAEAIAAHQQAIKLGANNPDTQIYLGVAYAKAGALKQAQTILKQLESGKPYVSPVALADFYVGLGEHEKALASLERAYATHDVGLRMIGISPTLDPLRAEPRFKDLLRRVGLAQKD
jgi:TolB-like protein/DNA-binding winged helix-turn-helix (wHTH) protein/Flp pilus assembly protein TadD